LTLGTINLVFTNTPLPTGQTSLITLGSTDTSGTTTGSSGGSDLITYADPDVNILQSTVGTTVTSGAPEPSGALVMLLGVAGVGLTAVRRRWGGKS
jgi:hypothetical protein